LFIVGAVFLVYFFQQFTKTSGIGPFLGIMVPCKFHNGYHLFRHRTRWRHTIASHYFLLNSVGFPFSIWGIVGYFEHLPQ
uniref:RSN1_7TM domain-containing protein n=1 Tax=Haemonchus placei TaxID=6290 RepID=A0A0N4XAD7_HAEPC